MELFTATEKLKKFFLTTRDVRCVCHRRHGTHRYDIQVLATHASTWVQWYSWPLDFCPPTRTHARTHTVSLNCLYHAWMVLSVGGSFAYFALNAHCTVTTELLVWYSNTQNDFSPGVAIFSLHTLASPSGRNVNYNEKQLPGEKIFWVVPSICTCFVNTCPTVFPIINFCNPRVHCETPCICVNAVLRSLTWTFCMNMTKFLGALPSCQLPFSILKIYTFSIWHTCGRSWCLWSSVIYGWPV